MPTPAIFATRIDKNASTLLVVALLTSACAGDPAPAATETGSDSQSSETQDGDGDGNGDGDLGCTPELESLRSEIFAPSCALASCHSSADAAAGLDLETADLEAELIGAPSGTCDGWIRVVPQAPDESLLYRKIAGPAPCGDLMPAPNGLPPDQVACVRTWIEELDDASCETCSGDACVDLDGDAQNCGECGNACPDGIACDAGECACPGAQQLCDDTCVDVQTDPQHCGGCSGACELGQVCSMGECSSSCDGLSNCDGACVDLDSNPDHCGECGNTCEQGSQCELGSCGCPADPVSFAADVEPMLVDGCTSMGCHGAIAPSAGLDMRAGMAYGNLVNVASTQCDNRLLVAPGQVGDSYLIDKLLGVNMCFGSQMPKGASALSAGEIATISAWICRGALDD